MLRNVSEIKVIVFHISDSPILSANDWEDVQKIYESEYNCMFLTDLDQLPDFIDDSDIIKVEPLKMVLWPSLSLFDHIKERFNAQTTEIILVSKDSRFTKRSMKLLSGVILISENMVKYEQLDNTPDAIFHNFNQFYELVVLDNLVGRNYFGENQIPLPTNQFRSRYIHCLYPISDLKKVRLFSLGRYYSSRHYMHEMHPYSKAIISNKSSNSKLFGKFNIKLSDLIIQTIGSFPDSFKLYALCYVPPRPNEESRFSDIFEHIFSQTDTSVLTIDVERTFWEKLTILHKIANFPEGKSLPARYARHLYDVYNLGNSWVKESAFARKELLEKDVAFKQKFYYAKSAHYETATLNSIELMPSDGVLDALKADYNAMRNMIYGEILEFEEILNYLNALQEEVHKLTVN